MSASEFSAFSDIFDGVLKLPSGGAIRLRKALGKAIDSKLSQFPKGHVQQMKARFVSSSLALSGVKWESAEPHKIVSNLKNSGNGDQNVTTSLLFSCCKIYEFDELKEQIDYEITRTININNVDPIRISSFFRTRIYLSEFLSGNFSAISQIDNRNSIDLSFTEAVEDQKELNDLNKFGEIDAFPDSFMNKYIGRNFVEIELYNSILKNHSVINSSVSIIDVDDMTKINKIFGFEVGNIVLRKIYEIILDETKQHGDVKIGRCGDSINGSE